MRAIARSEGRSPLVLASRSPQRRAILERLGVAFEVRPAGVEEVAEGEPHEVALENARRKGAAVAGAAASRPVLAVDTVVALDGRLYGQPADEAAARATLAALSGRTHTVVSAFWLDGEEGTDATAVTFRALGEELLAWYLARGEWRGRAGAYAIQEAGAALVRRIEGDYVNVVGLPLAALLDNARFAAQISPQSPSIHSPPGRAPGPGPPPGGPI